VIERADVVDKAKEMFPHWDRQTVLINRGCPEEREESLCQQSLWWMLGRVIYSESVMVLGGDSCPIIAYPDGKTRAYEDSRSYVEVISDHDAERGDRHVFHVPSLVRCYAFSSLRNTVDDLIRQSTL
jgi:hypothetical protein